MSAVLKVVGGAASDALVRNINAMHERACKSARDALESAKVCGELLLQARATLKHGEWCAWMSKNLSFSARTATRYMQVSAGWEQIKSKSDTVSDLTLSGALHGLRPRARDVDVVHHHHVDHNPESQRALQERRELAALLLAWTEASPGSREHFLAATSNDINAIYRRWKAAA